MVKTSSYKAWGAGLTPGQGANIPRASGPKTKKKKKTKTKTNNPEIVL